MFELDVPTTRGVKKEIVYSIHDYPMHDLYMLPACRSKGKSKKTYYNVSAAFDIESTTIEPEYTTAKNGKKKYIRNPYAFMYQWQFCLNNRVVFGRIWEEFISLVNALQEWMELSQNRLLAVYVHNLPYEFQFMKDFFEFTSIFAKEKKKPLKATIKQGIEFRCSYSLSNMSLAKFCENSELCYHYKLVDTYDYRTLRTPDTPYFSDKFTASDLGYCYNDVRGLCECIDTSLQDDTIGTIPLTNTGYVRREFRSAMKSNADNYWLIQNTKLNADIYRLLKQMFRGGNTHCNRFFANTILTNVKSKDLQSSYPASMMLDLYPMGKFRRIKNVTQSKLDNVLKGGYACIIDCTFYGVHVKDDVVIPYIDISHCRNICNYVDSKKNREPWNDNGRILKAVSFDITICELDLEIIRDTYDYEGIEIHELYYTEKGKLPEEFRTELLKWYDAKTQLKDVDGKEYEYMKSKNRVNSSFGMIVTDIAHSSITYNQDTMRWGENEPILEKAIASYYKSQNSFLAYQWGCWVTANARYRLQKMLNIVGADVVYTDTDSIKYINPEKHEHEFAEETKRTLELCKKNDIRAYSEKDGKKYYLGIWDDDGEYLRFKTLGAKKYCYDHINKKGKREFCITVSGMHKEKGAKRVGCIENFVLNKTFTDIGRTTSWFNDEKPHTITVDGSTFTTASNIGVLDTTYTLGVGKEYWEVLCELLGDDEQIEEFLNNIY